MIILYYHPLDTIYQRAFLRKHYHQQLLKEKKDNHPQINPLFTPQADDVFYDAEDRNVRRQAVQPVPRPSRLTLLMPDAVKRAMYKAAEWIGQHQPDCWPFNGEEQRVIPEVMQEIRERFDNAYESTEPARTFVRQLGTSTKEKVKTMLQALKEFLTTTFPKLSGLISAFFSAIIRYFIDYAIELAKERLRHSFEQHRAELMSMILICANVFMAYLAVKGHNTLAASFSMILSGILAYFNIWFGAATQVVLTALHYNMSNEPRNEGRYWEYQSAESTRDLKRVFKNVLTVAAILKCETAGLNVSDLSPANIEKMMKRTVLVGRALQTWDALIERFADILDDTLQVVCKYIFSVDYVSTRHVAEIDDWCNEVMDMLSLRSQIDIGRDRATTFRIEYLYRRYMTLRTRYTGNKAVIQQLDTFGLPITTMYNKIVNKNPHANTMRKEPVCLVFEGDSGVGKSFLMEPIKQDLLKIAGRFTSVVDVEGQIYSRCKEQEFWDGYTGQPIVIFDDFAQQVDSIANPNLEWFELIRAVNIFPYALHSAALHEKANNPFNAEFVVLTTNVDVEVKPPSLHSQEAVIRRLHCVYKVDIIDQVKKQTGIGLDVHRLWAYQDRNGLPRHDTSHWTFTRRTYGKPTLTDLTYEDVLRDVSSVYRKHEDSYSLRQQNAFATRDNKLPRGVWSKGDWMQPETHEDALWWDDTAVDYTPTPSTSTDSTAAFQPELRVGTNIWQGLPYTWWIKQSHSVRIAVTRNGIPVWWNDYDVMPEEDVPELESVDELEKWLEDRTMSFPIPNSATVLDRVELTKESNRLQRYARRTMEEEMDANVLKSMHAYYKRATKRNPCWQNKTRYALAKAWIAAKAVYQGYWYQNIVKWVNIVGTFVLGAFGLYKLIQEITTDPTCNRHTSSYRAFLRWFYATSFIAAPVNPLTVSMPAILIAGALRHYKFHDMYPVNDCEKCTDAKKLAIEEDYRRWLRAQTDESEALNVPETKIEKEMETKFTPEQLAKFYFPSNPERGLKEMKRAQLQHTDIGEIVLEEEQKFSDDPESIMSRRQVVQVEKKDSEDPESVMSRRQIVQIENAGNLNRLLLAESERGFVEGKRKRYHAEGPASEQASELAYAMKRNQMFMYVEARDLTGEEPPMEVYIGQIFALKGRKALVNVHFLAGLEATYARMGAAFQNTNNVNVRFYFRTPGVQTRYYMTIDEFEESQQRLRRTGSHGEVLDTEFNVFDLPLRVPARRDITQHFVMKKDLQLLIRGTRMLLPTYTPKESGDFPTFRDGSFQSTTDIDLAPIGSQAVKRTFYQSGIVNISSAKGDCGAPYILADNKFPRKIVGVHFGGDAGRGSFSYVTQEDLRPYLEGEIHAPQSALTTLGAGMEKDFPFNDAFELVGKIPKAEYQPRDTDKELSPIANMVVTTGVRPSWKEEPLSPDGPMIKGIRKYVGHNQTVNQRILDEAVHSYKQVIGQLPILASDRRLLTFEEACAGIPGDDAYVGLKRKASAGYPYKNEKGAVGKNLWLGSGEKWDFTTDGAQRLRADVKNIIHRAQKYGEIPEILFIDTLKDECRPFEKVLAKKTRVFSAAPLHFSVVVRMYFAGWCAHKKRNFIDAESCVGIDAKSGGVKKHWSRLARHLSKFGEKSLIAGDFGNFDGTLVHDIHWAVLDVIEDFYQGSEDDRRVRRVLWEAMIHSKHILHDYVYQLAHGQPSGNALTVDVNSDYVSLLVRYVVGTLVGSCHYFNQHCRLVNYGDDHILAVSTSWQKLFTPATFGRAIAELGMVYTSESKEEQGTEYRDLEEVTFLKRGFVWCPRAQMWMAPLAMSSILEMTNWVTKSASPIEAVLRNCEDAIIELYFHDQPTCEQWTRKIREVVRTELDYDLPAIPWKTARSMISSGTLSQAYPIEMSHC